MRAIAERLHHPSVYPDDALSQSIQRERLNNTSNMPVYFYWGEDDFAMAKAAEALKAEVLDAAWAAFNYHKIPPDDSGAAIEGFNQAMTPPFGTGGRLVWLADTTICQQCSQSLLAELERTLNHLPDTTTLLLTTSKKPDARLKSTKLLQQLAQVKEFSPIPPWKQDQILAAVQQVAAEVGVKLTSKAAELLATAAGNNTRSLYGELEKLRLFAASASNGPLNETAVAALVTSSTTNSLQLANAILRGNIPLALEYIAELIQNNEPPLRIVATLTGQFRTWLWVKLAIETGERDEKEIAKAAEIPNPKRIYFLRQEVKQVSLKHLAQTLPLLLELEMSLKRGADDIATLQKVAIELCLLCRP